MMYLYDKALVSKFEKVFSPVIYAPTDKFYERYLLNTDNVTPLKLPAISIWRIGHEFDPYTAPTQLRVANFQSDYENDPLLAQQIFSLHMSLNYQIDLWAPSDIVRDDLLKEILFFLVRYPNISVEYRGVKFAFPVSIEPPDDTTDIADFDNTGDIFRVSLPVSIPDARLMFYEDVRKLRYVDLSIYTDNDLADRFIIS